MKKDKHNKPVLSEEQMDNIKKLGEVLVKIHIRLVKEGKIRVENGKVVWLKTTKK